VLPKEGNTEEKLASSIKAFTEKRRKQVYDSLNELEEERYNAFRESFGKSVLNKVVAVSTNYIPYIIKVHSKPSRWQAQDIDGGCTGDHISGQDARRRTGRNGQTDLD